MTERIYNVVKAPVGWIVIVDDVRIGDVHGTKDAAFEAAMVAALYAVLTHCGPCWDTPRLALPSGGRWLKLHFVDDAEFKGGQTAFDRLHVSFLTTADRRC